MKRITLLMTMLICFNACKKTEVAPIPEPKPKAEFSFYVGADGQVAFTNLSTDATSFKWDMGDFNSRSEKQFVHTYSRNKTYQVGLTATGKGGADVIVKSVTVSNLKGNLVVYKTFTTRGANIEVYVDGVNVSGSINGDYYFTSAPSCGDGYSVTVNNLNEGSHQLYAKEIALRPTTWNTNINIVGGVCTSQGLTK